MTINTKYNVGDKVWVLLACKAKCHPVYKISAEIYKNSTEIKYTLDTTDIDGNFSCEIVSELDVYSTKEELVNSIIN